MASITALLACGGGSKQSKVKTKKKYEVSNTNKSKISIEDSLGCTGSLSSLDKPSKKRKKPRTATEKPDTKLLRTYEEAIRRRDFQQVLWMIANGDVPADRETVNGENAILAAVAAKNADAVRMLVDSGVSIDSANLKGYTPLMKAIAAAAPFAEAASIAPLPRKALKQQQAPSLKLQDQNNSVTDLTDHPEHQHQFDNEIVHVVLELQPDVLKRDLLGKTAFDWAKCTGNLPALQLLETYHQANSLHNTASSSREQRIAECLALLTRHEEIVAGVERFLAQHRFDEREFVEFLKSSISKLPFEEFANCVADLKVARVAISNLKLLENDPKASFFINYETKQGWTPLTKAASNGYVAATQVLIELGAQLNRETVDQQTREDKTTLIHAVCNSQTKIVHHLLLALREQSYPAKAKDAFDTELMALNRRKSMESAWKRVVGPMENRLKWHEAFGNLVHWKDQQGKNALDYAEELGRDSGDAGDHQANAANAVLTQLRNAIRDAQDHAQYVEKNEERTRRTKCKSSGCDFVGPRDLMPVHEQRQCLKRIAHCEQCSAPIVFDMQDEHDRLECEMRRVPCVNLQHGCHERVLCKDLQSHATYHCRKRLVDCRLQCGKTLRFDGIVLHETVQCPHRIVECELGCPATFLANESGNHKRKHCPKRLVACVGDRKSKSGGCGASVAAGEMDFHLAHLCEKRKFACQWTASGCEEAIGGSPESRYHHEHRECPFRPVACRNGCALSGVILKCFLSEHYKWQCVLEPKPYPNHCEDEERGESMKMLPAHFLDVHVLEDAGDCEKRLTRCPLDLCGKRIRIFDLPHHQNGNHDNVNKLMSADLAISETERRRSHLRALRQRAATSKRFLDLLSDLGPDNPALPEGWELFTRSAASQFLIEWLSELHEQLESDLKRVEAEEMAHAVQCRVLTYAQADRKHLVEFSDGHSQWISLTLREYEILIPPSPAATTNDNSTRINPLTTFQCCLVPAGQVVSHTETECLLCLVSCPLECGQRLPSQDLSVHITKRCNMRNASCRLGCGSMMPYLSLSEHEELHCALRSVFCEHCHEQLKWQALATHLQKSCEKVPRRCRFGCSDRVSWFERESHEASQCPKRLVKCAKCEKFIWFCEQQAHETHECPLREHGLCDSKCGKVLKFNEIGHHLLFNCSQRIVTCQACDQRTIFAKLQEHKDLLCPQRFIHCRRGCGVKLREMDAELHEDGECSKRLVFCSNKCGVKVPCCSLKEHLELACEMRVIECPSDCQEWLFAYQFESHWRRCRQRIFPCGTGAKACARPIRLWFADRKLVRCVLHHENALLWALKTQDEDLVTYFLQNVQASQVLQEEFANGFSALSMAVSLGNVGIVKLLLRFGADVNLETSRGRTALAEACMAQHVELVELLVEHRANVSQTNRQGRNLMTMVRSLAANSASVMNSKGSDMDHKKWQEILRILVEREAMERDQRELFVAIATSNYDFMAQFLKFSSSSNSKSARPGNQTEMLRQDLKEKEELVQQAHAEHADAIRIFNESVADAESKFVNVSSLSEQVLDCSSQIQRVDTHHDASLTDSNALEVDMQKLIREITAQDIAKLLNVHVPSDEYLVVMKSIYMISGVLPRGRRNAAEYTDMEWWKAAQALLMDRTLLQRLRGYQKHIVTPDVMAKVRRECIRTPAFAASTVFFESLNPVIDDKDPNAVVERKIITKLPPVEELRGNIVALLAAWVKGVEMEYKSRAERQILGERKRRLAISLNGTQETLQQAKLDMQVATRSLPAHQEEVHEAKTKAEAQEKELFAAQQRLKTYKILNFSALNGHTPLSFASAVGNEAMVHMLLTHGALAGYAEEEKHLCASFVQLIIRDYLQKRRARVLYEKNLLLVARMRLDEAVDTLVRNVAFTFLLSHFRRKIAFFRQTHRVALHEAIFNGAPQIAEILLANGAKLWQKTHVLPLKMFPGAIVDQDVHSQAASHKLSGGWKLTPLLDDNQADTSGARRPMATRETLELAMRKYKAGKGWDPNTTHYSETYAFVSAALVKLDDALQQRRKEIAARKNVNKKASELKMLHAALEKAIISRDFHAVSELLDQGAYADYETNRDDRSALMAACIEEIYVENSDKRDVLGVEFLLDRPTNHPFVNFESSMGHTALSTAAFHGILSCAQILIDRGANVNQVSRVHGKTALMVAAANRNTEFVRFLVERPEIDVFMQDKTGKNAFAHARDNGFGDAMHLLGAAMAGNRGQFYSSVSALYEKCHPPEDTSARPSRTPHMSQASHDVSLERDAADIWAENLNHHVNKECRLRIVTCAQPKCGVSITQEPLEIHNRDACEFRIIHCSCGEQMTYQKHVVHAQNRCPMRLVSCPLDCGDSDTKLRFMDLKSHQNTECPNRRVRCRNGCTTNSLLFKERGHHEIQLYPLRHVHCKWGCDETVIVNSQQHHESEECLVRQLACPNKCGQLNVVFADLEHHVAELCARRLVVCTLGWGRKVPLHIMDSHVRSECRKRAVMCKLCSQQLVEDDRVAHQSSSYSQRISLCGLCGQTNILHGNLATHRAEQCKMRQVQCKYKCFTKLLFAHEKERHETSECAFRPIWCPFGCRQVFVANTLKKHECVCEMRFVACSLGCGTELRERDRLDYERSECSHSRQRQRRV